MTIKIKFLESEIARLSTEFKQLERRKKELDNNPAFVVVVANDLSYNKCFSFDRFVVQTDIFGATVFDSSDKCKTAIAVNARSVCRTNNAESVALRDLIVLRRSHLRDVISGLQKQLDDNRKS